MYIWIFSISQIFFETLVLFPKLSTVYIIKSCENQICSFSSKHQKYTKYTSSLQVNCFDGKRYMEEFFVSHLNCNLDAYSDSLEFFGFFFPQNYIPIKKKSENTLFVRLWLTDLNCVGIFRGHYPSFLCILQFCNFLKFSGYY